jgi:hypothetical protein
MDFWYEREERIVRLIRPYAQRRFEVLNLKGDFGGKIVTRRGELKGVLDVHRYRWCRNLFEKLKLKACKCAAVKLAFAPSWSFFVEQKFNYTLPGKVSASTEMVEMYEDFMERPPPGGFQNPYRKCNLASKKTEVLKPKHVRWAPKPKKNASFCSECGCVLGRAHLAGCQVRVANRAKRLSRSRA